MSRKPKAAKKEKQKKKAANPKFTVSTRGFLTAIGTVSDCLRAGRVHPDKQIIAVTATDKGSVALEGGPSSIDAITGDASYVKVVIDASSVTTPGSFVTSQRLLRLKYPGNEIVFEYSDKDAEISYTSKGKTGTMVTTGSLEKIRRNRPREAPLAKHFTSVLFPVLRRAVASVLFKASAIDDIPDVLVTLSLAPVDDKDIPKAVIKRNADDKLTHRLTAIIFDRQRSATASIFCRANRALEFDNSVFNSAQLHTFLKRCPTGVKAIKFGLTEEAIWLRAPDLMTINPQAVPALTAANVMEVLQAMTKTKPLFRLTADRDDLVTMAESALSVREAEGKKTDDSSTFNRVTLEIGSEMLLITADTTKGKSTDRVSTGRSKGQLGSSVDINVAFLVEAAKKHPKGTITLSAWRDAVNVKSPSDSDGMSLNHWIGTLAD